MSSGQDDTVPKTPIGASARGKQPTAGPSNPKPATGPRGPPSSPEPRVAKMFEPGASTTSLDHVHEVDPMKDIRSDIMVNWLQSQQAEKMWTTWEAGEGVVLKKAKGNYVCAPRELATDGSALFAAVAGLNVRVAMTINTTVIQIVLNQACQTSQSYVEISKGHRLQVIQNMQSLSTVQRHQFAAFVAEPRLLIVWEDDPERLLDRAADIQEGLVHIAWGSSRKDRKDIETGELLEDESSPMVDIPEATEAGVIPEQPRRPALIQALMVGLTLWLLMTAMGSGWRQIGIEIYIDRDYMRALFLLAFMPQLWLSLFFFQAIIGNVFQMFGPTRQMNRNSKFYSGKPPPRLPRTAAGYPHVTIQMPVYQEGLHTVIAPTIRSVKAAISTYELQGGTANIFINDDGMQTIPTTAAAERAEFYDEHNVGWVARPGHNTKDGSKPTFIRAGKFKKASNMNYGLGVSIMIEEKLANVDRHEKWSQNDENLAYDTALCDVLADSNAETWADGNVRIGEYILLIDSDTRLPKDCLLEAVSEMEASPQVAVIQYSAGVMNVTTNFFEKGITFFTDLIYTQIRYAVANGDVAPFVGHNAILRWSAMQDIAYVDNGSVKEKYWSEETVSEDFDMALRLQTAGYLIRLGAYKGKGFKEGVSLTVYDELVRWEKYAYGCSELIFHPLIYWPRRGPFTKLFRSFIWSSMPLPSKFTILAYIGTYYALSSAWITVVLNYFLVGWYNDLLDKFYIDSFRVYFSIIMIFTILGNFSFISLRYRLGEKSLFGGAVECLKWMPLLFVFLGGVSLHVSHALLCHLFSKEISWGATAKEAENVAFFEEIPRVLRRFKGTFVFCTSATAMMVVLALYVPEQWRIGFFTPIWPLGSVVVCHFLLPIALNPNLMRFTW